MRTDSRFIHYRSPGPRIWEIFYSIILFASVILIFNLYNIGTGGDFRYYVDNGANIFIGINPYLNDFRSGTFGPLAIYLFSRVIPEGIIQFSFYFLNILGIFSILYYFKSKLTFSSLVICFTLIIWSAPFREIVVDGQITGILYLLIFSAFLLLKRKRTASRYKTNVFIAALLSAVAVDLKPHICLPIILFIGLAQQRYRYLIAVLAVLISAHLLIDVWFRSFTELQWLQNLLGVQGSKNYSKWPEQYNIWPIFDHLLPGGYLFWKSLSVISVITIFALLTYLSIKRKEEIIWFIVASLSMVIPYSQFYSLTLLVSITLVRVLRRDINTIGYLFIAFILVPRYWTEPKNIMFICAILVIVSLYNYFNRGQLFFENIKVLIMAMVLNISIHVLNDQMIFIEDLERSVICVQVATLSFIYFLERDKLLLLFKKK